LTRAAAPDVHWRLVGARPCLDFVNTVAGRVAPRDGRAADFAYRVTREDIPDYESLLRWSVFASLVEPSESERLRDQARRSAPATARALRRAIGLREAIYRIGKALVEDWPLRSADLRTLDREVREARRRQRLVAGRRRLDSHWIRDVPRLDRMLWPVALSAAELFGSDDVKRLKQCAGASCGWLFVDTTRNHSRQWCEMADCGNLAKVRRFRQRQRRGRAGRRGVARAQRALPTR
jgi:predicted RNA-binding Zn ribbon-like protein